MFLQKFRGTKFDHSHFVDSSLVRKYLTNHRNNRTRMRAQLLLDAEYEADMRKKDGGRYGAKTAEVNFDFSRNFS